MFEAANQTLFAMINAPANTGAPVIFIAIVAAEWLLYLVAAFMVIGWIWRANAMRQALFSAGLAALSGLVLNQILRSIWPLARPFAQGIGQQFLDHAPDASFPSDHGTILFSIAFALILSKAGRGAGMVVLLMALATAWARVFLGVHWPLDMAGSFVVGLISAVVVVNGFKRGAGAAFSLVLRLYRWLLAALHLPAKLFPR